MYYLTPEQRKAAAQKGKETRRRNLLAKRERQHQLELQRDTLYQEVRQLEEKLFSLRGNLEIFEAIASLSPSTLLREEEIIQQAQQYEIPGIYFLIQNKKVMYVGQSVSVLRRIGNHFDKKFDSFAFVPCDKKVLDKLETLYIHLLRPPLNGEYSSGVKRSPFNLMEVLKGTAQSVEERYSARSS